MFTMSTKLLTAICVPFFPQHILHCPRIVNLLCLSITNISGLISLYFSGIGYGYNESFDSVLSVRYSSDESLDWTWSGIFRLDEIGEFALQQINSKAEIEFIRCKISANNGKIYVLFTGESLESPCYKLCNRTGYNIFYRQKLVTDEMLSRQQLIKQLPAIQYIESKSINKLKISEFSAGLNIDKQAKITIGDANMYDSVAIYPTGSLYKEINPWLLLRPGESRVFAWWELISTGSHELLIFAAPLNYTHFNDNLNDSMQYLCSSIILDNLGSSLIHPISHIYSDITIQGSSRVLTFLTQAQFTSLYEQNEFNHNNNNQLGSNMKSRERLIERIHLLFMFTMPKLYLSVVDNSPRELLLLTLINCNSFYQSSNIFEKYEIKLSDLQLDNQLMDSLYPVVIHQKSLHRRSIGKSNQIVNHDEVLRQRPFIHLSVVKLTCYSNLHHYKYAAILIQEFVIKLDQSFLIALMPFLNLIKQRNKRQLLHNSAAEKMICSNTKQLETALHISLEEKEASSRASSQLSTAKGLQPAAAVKSLHHTILSSYVNADYDELICSNPLHSSSSIYFENLLLNSIECSFSFNCLPSADQFFSPTANLLFNYSSSYGNSSDNEESEGDLINDLMHSYILMLANTEDAHFKFAGKHFNNVFTTRAAFNELLLNHYKSQLLGQVYEMLGSSHALGNPIGLFSNLGNGVFDLLNEPAAGIIKGPSEFGVGIVIGVGSLVKNTLHGVANTASSITGSLGNAVASLSADPNYLKQRKQALIKQPKHVASGLLSGGLHLGRGIFDGVTGIITSPIEGALSEGVEGFMKGVGLGLLGVVVKPVAGALDGVATLTDGIKNTTTLFDKQIKPQRYPRILYGAEQLLKVYSNKEITAHCFLNRRGQIYLSKHNMENYIDHVVIQIQRTKKEKKHSRSPKATASNAPNSNINSNNNSDKIVTLAYILTDYSIICARLLLNKNKSELLWSYCWNQIFTLERPNSTTIQLRIQLNINSANKFSGISSSGENSPALSRINSNNSIASMTSSSSNQTSSDFFSISSNAEFTSLLLTLPDAAICDKLYRMIHACLARLKANQLHNNNNNNNNNNNGDNTNSDNNNGTLSDY
jgi:hypothetical protein